MWLVMMESYAAEPTERFVSLSRFFFGEIGRPLKTCSKGWWLTRDNHVGNFSKDRYLIVAEAKGRSWRAAKALALASWPKQKNECRGMGALPGILIAIQDIDAGCVQDQTIASISFIDHDVRFPTVLEDGLIGHSHIQFRSGQ